MTERGSNFVEELANRLIEKLTDEKHICKYENQMGIFETMLKNLEASACRNEVNTEKLVQIMAMCNDRVTRLETERSTLKYIIGLVGAGSLIGWLTTFFRA